MASFHYSAPKSLTKEQLEKKLFKDVQKLAHYLSEHKQVTGSEENEIMKSYEQMILERCDVLGSLSRQQSVSPGFRK